MAADRSHIPLGLLCLGVSLAAAWMASGYAYGTVIAMGPGFVPTAVAVLLAILGVIILAGGGRDLKNAGANSGGGVASDSEPSEHDPVMTARAIGCICGAILLFGLLLKPLGLAATVFAVVLLAGLAHPNVRAVPLMALAAGLTVGACVVFVILLGLNIPLWPRLA